jgi:hypothetical protein
VPASLVAPRAVGCVCGGAGRVRDGAGHCAPLCVCDGAGRARAVRKQHARRSRVPCGGTRHPTHPLLPRWHTAPLSSHCATHHTTGRPAPRTRASSCLSRSTRCAVRCRVCVVCGASARVMRAITWCARARVCVCWQQAVCRCLGVCAGAAARVCACVCMRVCVPAVAPGTTPGCPCRTRLTSSGRTRAVTHRARSHITRSHTGGWRQGPRDELLWPQGGGRPRARRL